MSVCDECKHQVPGGGPCPRCCFGLALESAFELEDLGRYELLEERGRGAMGVVRRARDRGLERFVAIKMLTAGLFASEAQVRRFRAEARAAAKLVHPNLVSIYGAGEYEGHPWYAMELIEGTSLSRELQSGPLEPRRAARYVKAIAEAMEYAHGRGVFHRDIKPSNVLLDTADQPRVADFGLARHVEVDSRETATGEVLGTPSFMPPEQARGERAGDARGDVYSMGATLYALLSGRAPFQAATPLETLRRVIEEDVPPLPRPIPRELETICHKALSKDPAQRYPTSQALAEELGRWLVGEPIVGQRVSVARRALEWARRRPTAVLATAFMALATVAGLSLRRGQLEGNRYSAQQVAPSVLRRFQVWGSVLSSSADSRELRKGLQERNQAALHAFAAERRAAAGDAFESVIVLDELGVVLARDPPNAAMTGRSFERRDYFQGAVRNAANGAVHVSRVFPGQFDNLIKFAVSMPIVDGSSLRGVLAATIASDSTMGLASLHDAQHNVVIVGPWDAEREVGDVNPFEVAPEWVVVLHPAFKHGDAPLVADSQVIARQSTDPSLAELVDRSGGDSEANYQDPMRSRDFAWAGPWLVGMAPVGNTEYVVLVQTRDWIGSVFAGSLAVLVIGLCAALVRNRRWRFLLVRP